jgi:hypothetical protein
MQFSLRDHDCGAVVGVCPISKASNYCVPYVFWVTTCFCVNSDSTTAVSREQICGHVVPQATRQHAIMGEMFLCRLCCVYSV